MNQCETLKMPKLPNIKRFKNTSRNALQNYYRTIDFLFGTIESDFIFFSVRISIFWWVQLIHNLIHRFILIKEYFEWKTKKKFDNSICNGIYVFEFSLYATCVSIERTHSHSICSFTKFKMSKFKSALLTNFSSLTTCSKVVDHLFLCATHKKNCCLHFIIFTIWPFLCVKKEYEIPFNFAYRKNNHCEFQLNYYTFDDKQP